MTANMWRRGRDKRSYSSRVEYRPWYRIRPDSESIPPLNVTKQPPLPRQSPGGTRPREKAQHVSFTPLPQESAHLRQPSKGQQQRPPSGRAGDVTALDHKVARHGGTTSTLETLPRRLRTSRQTSSSPWVRLEEAIRENGYLGQELAYYKDTHEVLMRLYSSIRQSHQEMKDALDEASKGVAISEQRLLNYLGKPSNGGRRQVYLIARLQLARLGSEIKYLYSRFQKLTYLHWLNAFVVLHRTYIR